MVNAYYGYDLPPNAQANVSGQETADDTWHLVDFMQGGADNSFFTYNMEYMDVN